MMKLQQADSFSLENFDGPIKLLCHLIQKEEIDIFEISIRRITGQYAEKEKVPEMIDIGAEFIASAASLIWLKSKALLPQHSHDEQHTEEDADPGFEIIHQLIDYCCFRQAAKELVEREQKQAAFYVRGIDETPAAKHLGISHLTIDELAEMFRQALAKAAPSRGVVYEEPWKVADKISMIRQLLAKNGSIPFNDLFAAGMTREELIVTFLALLELMKTGESRVNASHLIEKGPAIS